jgi:hypothetical protein
MFSTTKAALVKAVKQVNLTTWPGLIEDAINKHLKLRPATAMGHMNHKGQHICCTSKVVTTTSDLEDTTVTPAGNGDKTHLVDAVLNYSRSRNPTRVRAHTQRHIQAPREPLNSRVCWRVCTLSQDRT